MMPITPKASGHRQGDIAGYHYDGQLRHICRPVQRMVTSISFQSTGPPPARAAAGVTPVCKMIRAANSLATWQIDFRRG